jgi:hypothetical protein
MGKRGNENSQLSKEEMAVLEERDENNDQATGESFSKASENVLANRRIVKTSRYAYILHCCTFVHLLLFLLKEWLAHSHVSFRHDLGS